MRAHVLRTAFRASAFVLLTGCIASGVVVARITGLAPDQPVDCGGTPAPGTTAGYHCPPHINYPYGWLGFLVVLSGVASAGALSSGPRAHPSCVQERPRLLRVTITYDSTACDCWPPSWPGRQTAIMPRNRKMNGHEPPNLATPSATRCPKVRSSCAARMMGGSGPALRSTDTTSAPGRDRSSDLRRCGLPPI
jgi:hypothetical protein